MIKYLMLTLLISFFIGFFSFVMTQKNNNTEKTSVYECGFSPIYEVNSPFSMKFFMVAILFLVFDLEMIILYPWSVLIKTLCSFSYLYMNLFLLMLILGLMYEWIKGGLEWN